MPWYAGDHSETVAASPEEAFAAMTDYEGMPSWQGPLSRCEVLERDGDGAATAVEYEISTPVRRIVYRLRHTQQRPDFVSGELIDGDVKGFRGEWRFTGTAGGSTRVDCEMAIDPGVWVPRRIARMLHDTVLRRAVSDLKAELERERS